MPDPRHYTEEEVSRLLARAAAHAERAEQQAAARGTPNAIGPAGLTLAQVQEIATAVGIPADAIERAAAAEARGDLVPTTRRVAFGIPFGVSRQVELPRPMTDVEWERVVVRLRETFEAEGRTTREGSIRSWRNGNLRVVVEPTANGSRVRMSTTRGDASLRRQVAAGGIALSAALVGWFTLAAGTAASVAGPEWGAVGVLSGLGVTLLIRNTLALPRWARIRSEQMEALSQEIGDIVEGRE